MTCPQSVWRLAVSLRGPRQAGALGSSPLLCPGAGFAAGLNKYGGLHSCSTTVTNSHKGF